MSKENYYKLSFPSRSVNESFARMTIASFCMQFDPTIEQINDIKTAVSEAVTNCVVHAYPDSIGTIYITATIKNGVLKITVKDKGIGIPDISRAMEPMFTTDSGSERAGLGFAVMQAFMDKVKVYSTPGKGTRVVMTKTIEQG
ncbi:MAG: anti-sigma F factor [Oscillospiraceae bacterium]|nr:anti-sigma F factor [Oscillospiraceae bacterium]